MRVHDARHRRRAGRPWASPVYFAHDRFLWLSAPDNTHSRNIAARPEVGISIFDLHVPVGQGQGVYIAAEAAEVHEADRERLVAVYSARSEGHVGRTWGPGDVEGPLHLFCARATEVFVLDPAADRDVRVTVTP